VVSVTGFDDYDDAISIANDTLYGLGRASGPGTPISATGPAGHSGWPGVDEQLPHLPGACRVRWLQVLRHRPGNHLMTLEQYQQTKNLLVSYDQNRAGFFCWCAFWVAP
jgi:aldehyde dehydrogenase